MRGSHIPKQNFPVLDSEHTVRKTRFYSSMISLGLRPLMPVSYALASFQATCVAPRASHSTPDHSPPPPAASVSAVVYVQRHGGRNFSLPPSFHPPNPPRLLHRQASMWPNRRCNALHLTRRRLLARALLALLGLLDDQRLALQQHLERLAVHALARGRVQQELARAQLELVRVLAVVRQQLEVCAPVTGTTEDTHSCRSAQPAADMTRQGGIWVTDLTGARAGPAWTWRSAPTRARTRLDARALKRSEPMQNHPLSIRTRAAPFSPMRRYETTSVTTLSHISLAAKYTDADALEMAPLVATTCSPTDNAMSGKYSNRSHTKAPPIYQNRGRAVPRTCWRRRPPGR